MLPKGRTGPVQTNLVGGGNEAGCPWITVSVEGIHDEARQHSTHQDDQQTQEVEVQSSEKACGCRSSRVFSISPSQHGESC